MKVRLALIAVSVGLLGGALLAIPIVSEAMFSVQAAGEIDSLPRDTSLAAEDKELIVGEANAQNSSLGRP